MYPACHTLSLHDALRISRELAGVLFGIEASVVEFEELSAEVDQTFAVAQQSNNFQRFCEAADRLREIETVRHGVLGLATAEAEDEAAFRQMVDRQRALREQRRVASQDRKSTRLNSSH